VNYSRVKVVSPPSAGAVMRTECFIVIGMLGQPTTLHSHKTRAERAAAKARAALAREYGNRRAADFIRIETRSVRDMIYCCIPSGRFWSVTL
jgi:hypothetical protein